MDITYQPITAAEDRLKLYRFRKQVFVDEEKRWHTDDDHITDLYDSLDETVNLAAVQEGEIIAALRVTMENDAGFPTDRFWDSRAYRRQFSGRWVNFGWLCCTQKHRHTKGLIKNLITRGGQEAKAMGATDVLSLIHPPVYEMLHKCFDVIKIGEAFQAPRLNVEMIPIHTRVDEILARYRAENSGLKVRPSGPGFQGKAHFLETALSRNLGVLSVADQERLSDLRVAIPGLGGVGGQHLITLARTGIGNFSLAEFDSFEAVNFNRQYGARLSTLNRSKLDVMVEDALDINPYLGIRTFPDGVCPENVDAFLEGADLVADGIDFFNMEARRLVFSRARQRGIPVITAGPLGFGSALLIFMPDRGMDFDAYFNLRDDQPLEEQLVRFFVGLAPRAAQAAYIDPAAISMAGQRGPSTGAGCLLCSAALSAEAVRILLGKPGVRPAPHYFQYDPFVRKFYRGYLPMGNRNLVQRLKIRLVKTRLNSALPAAAGPERSGDPARIIADLIDAGCQAPSGDNCQPWRFSATGNRIDLYLRPGADTCFFNFEQTASLIACGAALENICLAATRFGMSAHPALLPSPDRPDFLARIMLETTGGEESRLARFIWARHTNRTAFSGRPIPETDIATLDDCLSDFPGTRLTLIRDGKGIAALSGLIYEADLIRTRRRDLHTHLMNMIRFSREQALATRDGFPLKNLEAGILGEAFLRVCRPWPVMNLFNRLGLGNTVARAAAHWAKKASVLGLITVRGKDREAVVKGGQAMERLWLTATALGLSFQPLTALTLFRNRWDAGGRSDFAMSHQQRLGRIWPLFDHFFPTEPDDTRVMLFRLGFGRTMSCRTLRRYQGKQLHLPDSARE